MNALEERIASLERTIRRWRILAVTLAGIFAAALLVARPLLHEFVWSRVRLMTELDRNSPFPAESIRAKRLEIVNDQNVVVARIGAAKDGDGQIKLFDGAGKDAVLLGAETWGGSLSILGNDGKSVVWISGLPDRGVVTALGPKSRATLSGVGIDLGLNVPFDTGDTPETFAKKTEGARRVKLGMFDDGGGFVHVSNPSGKVVAEMQCSKANAGLIMANDFDGNLKEALSGAK